MNIAVIGTGYVGLVTGACFAEFGVNVICVDNDPRKLEILDKGEIPFFEPGLKELVERNRERDRLVFTGDIRQIDQPYLDSLSNGLSYLINRMKDQPIYAHVTLEKGERSALSDLASSLL